MFSIGFDVVFWAHIPAWNVFVGSGVIITGGLVILYREVVHKGRQARLSMYGLTPIRPTQADLVDDLSGRETSDTLNKKKKNKDEIS